MTNEKELRENIRKWADEETATFGGEFGEDNISFKELVFYEILENKIVDLLHSHTKEVVEDILKACQEDVNFGAEHQQIVSTKGQSKCMVLLASLEDNKLIEELLGKNAITDYANNYSHYHCWNQTQPPACGIPLEKHTQCCLCGKIYEDNKKA